MASLGLQIKTLEEDFLNEEFERENNYDPYENKPDFDSDHQELITSTGRWNTFGLYILFIHIPLSIFTIFNPWVIPLAKEKVDQTVVAVRGFFEPPEDYRVFLSPDFISIGITTSTMIYASTTMGIINK